MPVANAAVLGRAKMIQAGRAAMKVTRLEIRRLFYPARAQARFFLRGKLSQVLLRAWSCRGAVTRVHGTMKVGRRRGSACAMLNLVLLVVLPEEMFNHGTTSKIQEVLEQSHSAEVLVQQRGTAVNW